MKAEKREESKRIDVKKIVGDEVTPEKDGAKLAAYLVSKKIPLSGLVLDVSTLAPEDLVSSFVNSILHALEQAGVKIEPLRDLQWVAKFESEAARLKRLVTFYLEDRAAAPPPKR